jgi:hypothetical protein
VKEMKELFTLGDIYVSDFLQKGEESRGGKVELKMLLNEENGCVRLEKQTPLDNMFGKYWYRSGINHTMKKELKEIVDSIFNVKKLNDNDIWVDIACNDGTLLSYLPDNLIRIGIDPVDDSFKKESEKHADLIIQDYFKGDLYKESKFGHLKAKIVTTIAMFYDLEDPKPFIKDVYDILEDDGLWVIQMSYTPLMIKQLAFDNICHEHMHYYSLFNIKNILENNGFKVVDCQLNDVNGGSFRVYVVKNESDLKTFATQPYRDVSKYRVDTILTHEMTLGLDKEDIWLNFFSRINKLKEKTLTFIKEEKSKGKIIWGYGASTKGNTLLQYFGLDSTIIDGIAERNIDKWGLYTVGTNIPIYSEDEMRKVQPDYLLVLPWHFINEFVDREREYINRGGKFIVPCPNFEIISK